MDTEKERAKFEAWAGTFDHDSDEWEDMPRDEVFSAGMQAVRASLMEEIEGLRKALGVFANQSNWLETLDVNAEVITWEHESMGRPWKFAQKAISDSPGDIESRIDAITERSRLRVENEELRALIFDAAKSLCEQMRMPNIGHVADDHNDAVKAIRAAAKKMREQSND